MVRAYLATLAPVVFRVALPSSIGLGMTPSSGLIALLLWASWVVPLSVYGVGRVVADARSRRKQVSMLSRGAGLGAG